MNEVVMGRTKYPMGSLKRVYSGKSIKDRLLEFFLDNVGCIVTRPMLIEVAKDPVTGVEPENWHQRLSELRTDFGYTILAKRDLDFLNVGEYILESSERRVKAGGRVVPTPQTWQLVLENANHCCEWAEGGEVCGLKDGDLDPIGGGTVRLTADHKNPHSINPDADPSNPAEWQALCGRHQVTKRNYWDSNTGKLNAPAIVQAATRDDKEKIFNDLKRFFGEE